jgi:hypothetical protein
MKILFLALEPPYPANDGGRIRTFNILKQAARRHAVTLLTSADPTGYPGAQEVLRDSCDEFIILPPPLLSQRKWTAKIGNLKRRYPVALDKHNSVEFRRKIKSVTSNTVFDLVHVDQIYLAQYIDILRDLPAVLTHHNAEVLAQRRELWRRKDRFRPYWWLYWLEYLRWIRYETEISRQFNALVAVSELEADYFKSRAPNVPTFVVPNGVDTEYFKPAHQPSKSTALLFAGRMDYAPNIDAMTWFCRKILPNLQQSNPDITLTIVGRDPTSSVRKLAEMPGVSVTGTVPNVRPYYNDAALFIVPLRQGGGTRLKILEAMAMQMPIVSTKIGMEGLQLHPGQDILLADTANEFVSQLEHLIADPSRRDQLGKMARQTVLERYDWQVIAEEQEIAYQAAIESHCRGRGK